MMSLHHGWACHPIQTSSPFHNRHIQSVWAHWYSIHRHMVAAFLSYTHHIWLRSWVIWLTCRVKMMSWHHGWGFNSIQTASRIHIKHIQSVWAHWYALHRHRVAALLSYTHPTWLRYCWSGSLVESKRCHCIMIEPALPFKLLLTSILDIYKVLSTLIYCP